MQYPPIKALDAVVRGTVDYRTRRLAMHFRHFFRCLNAEGETTDDANEIATIELTQRGWEYYERIGQRRQ